MLPTARTDRRRGRHVASLSLLFALLLGYVVIYLGDDNRQSPSELRRSMLQVQEEVVDDPTRTLAVRASPPAMDEIAGEYVVKPWLGSAHTDTYETLADTKLRLASVQASSVGGASLLPRFAIDDPNLATRWASSSANGDEPEWVNVDMGMPQSVREVYIKWHDAFATDYRIQVARERTNCRSNGESCPESWITVATVSGKHDALPTSDTWEDDDHALQGVRYVRVQLDARAPGHDNFSVYYIRVYRKPMIVGGDATGVSCGSTTAAAASSLLGKHGGSLLQIFDMAGFFTASFGNEAQKEAMLADSCVFTVEPNYKVRARGVLGGGTREDHRRLAIPEFNLKDENPPNWGLERISSHGRRNGKYTWFHEGTDTQVYVLDTGVYPDHSDWTTRGGSSRLNTGLICEGAASNHESTNHGTHVASLAGGWSHGTAKSAEIIPIQVLDANGEGSVASVLCGVESVLEAGKVFYAENAPAKMRAVVVMSFGADGRSDALDRAVQSVTDAGYVVVIAAGNHGDNACFYSPHHASAITVGALKDDPSGFNDKTATSNYGECVDVWAPGEDVVGASNEGEYESALMSGTSSAAAFAAGAAALFFEGINTADYHAIELAARVKMKLLNKAEVNALGEIGHGSVNKALQTTVSKCSLNSHCMTGLTCLRDGTCVDLTQPLRRVKSN